jgi:hypothetical protein
MGSSKRSAGPVKKVMGRPRVNAIGSQATYTNLAPNVREALDALAARERRSTSLMLAVLVEEALRARGELK